jgi:hypothetical protein
VIVSSNTGSWHKTYYNAIGNKVREVTLIDNNKHSITDIVYIVFDNTLIITTDIFGSFGDLSLVVIGNGICTISGIDVDILAMLMK